MPKIRICQLITELRPAGAERCVYELATRLDPARFEVQVAALRGGAMVDQLRQAGIPCMVVDVRGKWDVLRLRRLVDYLRHERFDVLHTHLFHADAAGRLAAHAAAVPSLVHTVHIAEGRWRPWHFAFARLASSSCERIVAVSHAVRDFHSAHSGLPHSAYSVIPNGIDAGAYSDDAAARQELRRRWGLADGDVLLGFVGRLDRQKGLDVLISAMSHLGAQGRPHNLVIAGDGPMRSTVENFIAHGEGGRHTRWLGFTPDVRGVLSAADIFVMPSRWEGFGLAAAEAMAAGLPVVGTRVPGLSEVLVDGQTALIVRPDDVFELTAAIERLMADADLRRRLGEAGAARVRELYRIDANIAAHEQLYAEVVERREAGARGRESLKPRPARLY